MSRRFSFLQSQIQYVTTHLQLADQKAGAVIVFNTVLCGCSLAVLSETVPAGSLASGDLLKVAVSLSMLALSCAFVAVLPRLGAGRDVRDLFSWLGVSESARATSHFSRLQASSDAEYEEALADTVEMCSVIAARKYSVVRIAIALSAMGTIVHVVAWILVVS